VVLEARDRLGGRILTKKIGDTVTDLGASYVHGQKGNPVAELASNIGLELGPAIEEHEMTAVGFTSKGDEATKLLYAFEGEFLRVEEIIENQSRRIQKKRKQRS